MTKLYKVSYYEWSFNRYGDKDYDYVNQWVDESALNTLQNDSRVDELEIHEEMEVADAQDLSTLQ